MKKTEILFGYLYEWTQPALLVRLMSHAIASICASATAHVADQIYCSDNFIYLHSCKVDGAVQPNRPSWVVFQKPTRGMSRIITNYVKFLKRDDNAY